MLAFSGEQRQLLIRQYADAHIAGCAQQKAQAEAAAAAAKKQQEEQQRQAEQERQRQAAEKARAERAQAVCAQVGGKFTVDGFSPGCSLTYKGKDGASYHYQMHIDAQGNPAPRPGVDEAACTSGKVYGFPGVWPADTQICAV